MILNSNINFLDLLFLESFSFILSSLLILYVIYTIFFIFFLNEINPLSGLSSSPTSGSSSSENNGPEENLVKKLLKFLSDLISNRYLVGFVLISTILVLIIYLKFNYCINSSNIIGVNDEKNLYVVESLKTIRGFFSNSTIIEKLDYYINIFSNVPSNNNFLEDRELLDNLSCIISNLNDNNITNSVNIVNEGTSVNANNIDNNVITPIHEDTLINPTNPINENLNSDDVVAHKSYSLTSRKQIREVFNHLDKKKILKISKHVIEANQYLQESKGTSEFLTIMNNFGFQSIFFDYPLKNNLVLFKPEDIARIFNCTLVLYENKNKVSYIFDSFNSDILNCSFNLEKSPINIPIVFDNKSAQKRFELDCHFIIDIYDFELFSNNPKYIIDKKFINFSLMEKIDYLKSDLLLELNYLDPYRQHISLVLSRHLDFLYMDSLLNLKLKMKS